MSALFDELKRRKVFRVSVMYSVVGWLLIQVGDTTFEPIGVPEGSLRIWIIAVLAGFPFAIAIGWVFDWTSEGIVRTSSGDASPAKSTNGPRRGKNFPLLFQSALQRTKIPILMINGKHDYIVSVDKQKAFFDLL